MYHVIFIHCWDWLDKSGFWKHDKVREWETRHKNSEKSEDQGPNRFQGEGDEMESKQALLYFQLWIKECAGS